MCQASRRARQLTRPGRAWRAIREVARWRAQSRRICQRPDDQTEDAPEKGKDQHCHSSLPAWCCLLAHEPGSTTLVSTPSNSGPLLSSLIREEFRLISTCEKMVYVVKL